MTALMGLDVSCRTCSSSAAVWLRPSTLTSSAQLLQPRSSQQLGTRGRGRPCGPVALKKDIHPEYYEESKVFCNGEEVLTVSGTKKSYTVDVWSGNHPFFTGSNQALIVDEGRVNKFQKRFQGLSLGQVAPVAAGGNKKLEYKTDKDKKKKKGGKR